jgi:hypothetical protein
VQAHDSGGVCEPEPDSRDRSDLVASEPNAAPFDVAMASWPAPSAGIVDSMSRTSDLLAAYVEAFERILGARPGSLAP